MSERSRQANALALVVALSVPLSEAGATSSASPSARAKHASPSNRPSATPGTKPTPTPAPDFLADARAQARAGHREATLAAIDQALSYHLTDASQVLIDPDFRDFHGDADFRRLIRNNAESKATLVGSTEPGTRLDISGVVRDASGAPVLGALIYVFQTDAAGRYTTSGTMDEPKSRLFAYLRTQLDGRYELHTIRPGGYPETQELQGQSRLLPAHIHFEVSGSSSRMRRFQLVFADDPRLDAHWRAWAKSADHPVAVVEKAADGSERVVLDITLQPR